MYVFSNCTIIEINQGSPCHSQSPLINLVLRLRNFTYAGRIPGVSPEAWKVVADARDPISHKPATNLTRPMLDAGGRDQMSIRQTRTFFSTKVQTVMRLNGCVIKQTAIKS